MTHTHRPKPALPLCEGFALMRIASQWNVGGRWVVLVGHRSEIPPTSDFILVTQVRALICCLFITQSGSCTVRPPRLLCCFPFHQQQIPWDTTSSPLSSTATKTQTSKGLAWQLNKSACNSVNQHASNVKLQHRSCKIRSMLRITRDANLRGLQSRTVAADTDLDK